MSDEMAPFVRVQWKGTDACFDLWCECSLTDPQQAFGHFDGYQAYAIECTNCGRKWDLPQELPLLPFSGTWEPQPVRGFAEDV